MFKATAAGILAILQMAGMVIFGGFSERQWAFARNRY